MTFPPRDSKLSLGSPSTPSPRSPKRGPKYIVSVVCFVLAVLCLLGAIWLYQDWGWLKFGLSGVIFVFVGAALAMPSDTQKRL